MRKQLLLLESDLNRRHFAAAMEEWKTEFHRSKQKFTHLGSMFSTGAKIAATVSSARGLLSRPAAKSKKSWRSLLFDGLKTGVFLWCLSRTQRQKQDD